MLAKPNRLTKKKDFESIFKEGKKYGIFPLKIYLKKVKNNLPESRFGIIVSKKISNKAVVRNKIKRRLRELIKKNLSNIEKGFDIVIIILPEFEKNDFLATEDAFNKLFQKACLFKKQ